MPYPGFRNPDDWFTATQAAAAGGTTMVLDFIPVLKGEKHCEWLEKWEENAKTNSIIDYSFHMTIVEWTEEVREAIKRAASHGITSVKAYLAYKGRIMLGNDNEFLQFFKFAAENGVLPMTHCEDGEIIEYLQNEYFNAGHVEPKYHPLSRPQWVEGTAAKHATALAAATKSPLYIVHNTCVDSVDVIEHANYGAYPVFGECTITHLTCTDELNSDPNFDIAAGAVLSPPLRTETDRLALWSSLRRGVLNVISTDHCPIYLKDKRRGLNDFRAIPNGCPDIEERMVLAWYYGVHAGLISPNEYVAVTSANAAKIFGCYPRKGIIAPGSDADVVIIDPKAKRVINAATQKGAVDYTLWENLEVTGIPVVTISHGEVVWEVEVVDDVAQYAQGKLSTQKGRGHFIGRKTFHPFVYGRQVKSEI
ncbi:D-hydantoinase family protein [Tritrichomonas foetus]|uniref:dihydropyrimidinase n=1 Tax=Tritrichomonas foetus TaxID=1144522 RepID=A0A1J4KV84_9EUKA|nr:D-hydantoinase family protein [Tritrichomonas foetus]|eukprot:OHT15143.1 D-hydantoinase family protein [Tritrichomonas foetus]